MDEIDIFEDVDEFIRNIEQSAPVEEVDLNPRCEQCDHILNEVEGGYVCPNCHAQATNIQQLEETEITQYDEMGRAAFGQQVRQERKKPRSVEDYGYAWSTDQAVIIVLTNQLKALQKTGLFNETFCMGVMNMWTLYWLEFIGPIIKDEYDENDLIPWDQAKYLKQRDIEVLVKKNFKFYLPHPRLKNKSNVRLRSYTSASAKYIKSESLQTTSNSLARSIAPEIQSLIQKPPRPDLDEDNPEEVEDKDNAYMTLVASVDNLVVTSKKDMVIPKRDQAIILTLDRTLSFIEAAARVMNLDFPIFASDLVRWCNYRIIPFYGAHRLLPDCMKLNSIDRLMFVKNRSPDPLCITLSASRLLNRIYESELPKKMPRPDLDQLLERYTRDMNLPYDLFDRIRNRVHFNHFANTRTKILSSGGGKSVIMPQYDRWAFAILACHLKRLFDMSGDGLSRQDKLAKERTATTGLNHFSFLDWLQQIALRLDSVFKYDPFVIFHPMTDIRKLELNSASIRYIESLIEDRPPIDIRVDLKDQRYDRDWRDELSDFLMREIPKPNGINSQTAHTSQHDNTILRVTDLKHPLRDAWTRTKPLWSSQISSSKLEGVELRQLMEQDYTSDSLELNKERELQWSIYDNQPDPSLNIRKLKILNTWPEAFLTILRVGGYLCLCEPEQLLQEISKVEDFMNPGLIVEKRRLRGRMRANELRPENYDNQQVSYNEGSQLEPSQDEERDMNFDIEIN